MTAPPKRILLIIGGGIAAYKSLDLIRRLRERGMAVRVILTRGGAEFVTPLSIGAIAGEAPYESLFDPRTEFDVGHIRLARETDLIVIAPATANLMARMAGGHADDLATAVLLATDAPILLAPAMNPHMWSHKATRRNLARLQSDGLSFVGPNEGEMAEAGEWGVGRMAEVPEILAAIESQFSGAGEQAPGQPLAGRHVLVTSGPTYEPLDPVRYIANRSSGRQGHAIAAAAAILGARTTLIAGPSNEPAPGGVRVVHVETAGEMAEASLSALPADIAVCAAAVADWRAAAPAEQKVKKEGGVEEWCITLVKNPDILKTLANHLDLRPELVIGFAAETERVEEHARAKLAAKGCDWIVANDVSETGGAMGGDRNSVTVLRGEGADNWPEMTKHEVALRLMREAASTLTGRSEAAE